MAGMQSNPTDLNAPAPSNPNNDFLSTLAAATGLGLNVAGAATRTGAVGDKTLNYAEGRQADLDSQYKQALKQRQAAQDQQTQALSDQEQLKTFTPMLSKLSPDQAAIAKSYMTANDLKGTQSYMERAMADNRADERLNKTLRASANSDDDKEIKGGIDEAQTRYKEIGASVDKSVAGAMLLQKLASAQDLSNGPPDAKKLGIVDKQLGGKSTEEVQQLLDQAYSAAGGPNAIQRTLLGAKAPSGTDVYHDLAAKIVGPEAVQDHLNKNAQMDQQKNTVDLLKFVKAYKNNPDPAIQAKVQTYRQAVLAGAKQ